MRAGLWVAIFSSVLVVTLLLLGPLLWDRWIGELSKVVE
jgi:hypothetical protein